VTLWSAPDKRYAARLREIAPAADPATRTYLAKFAMPDADAAAQLGMTATVTLAAEGSARVARLPLSALFNQGAGPVVWTIGPDSRPVMKPVTVAAYEAREVLVSSGLQDGDEVVTLGVAKLDEGQRVRVVEALQF
jgi:RND family efflux transporter MFP subunit